MAKTGEFSFFALSSAPGSVTWNADIDEHGRSLRKRRQHAKSRAGCATCKGRRVKCDERRPICSNCSSRSFDCNYDSTTEKRPDKRPDPRHSLISPESSVEENHCVPEDSSEISIQSSILRQPISKPLTLDLDVMKLLHHFETSTCNTLTFGSDLWRHHVIPLAVQHEYLMHSVLLLAAAHIRYSEKSGTTYHEFESYHLSQTLQGFRAEMLDLTNTEKADVRVACALGLLHYSWTIPYSPSFEELIWPSPSTSSLPIDVGADNLITFSIGLRLVVAAGWHARKGSIFHDLIASGSYEHFREWSAKAKPSNFDFNCFFPTALPSALANPPNVDYESCRTGGCVVFGSNGCAIVGAVERLLLILHSVDAQRHGTEVLRNHPTLSSYVMMWISKSADEFGEAVSENEPEALLVMLLFYASADELLYQDFWWVRERARFMCNAILGRFRNGTANEDFDLRLDRVCTYFGLER